MLLSPEEQEGRGVSKVVVERSLFDLAVKRGLETPTEVAFFMIGLVRGGVAYVYDLVEFDYKEKSPVSVRSGLNRKLRIAGMLPLGLKLLGNMHKHPGSPTPSSTDREMFFRYHRGGGHHVFVIYTVSPVRAKAYTVEEGEIVEIDCDIRELEEEERLISLKISLSLDIGVCLPKGISLLELRSLLCRDICREVVRQIGYPRLVAGGKEISEGDLPSVREMEIKPLRPLDLEVGMSSRVGELFYRLYLSEEDSMDYVISALREAFGDEVLPDEDKLIKGMKSDSRG